MAYIKSNWLPWLGAALVIGLLVAFWKPLSQVGTDVSDLRVWISQMGPLAPVVFFGLNIVQIVVAPIPGYPVQVLGGVLFDFIPGSIYTVGGMVAGGVLAAWLGRRLGRPWLENRVGPETLEEWSKMAHIDSFWTWWFILLIPLGDIPYFIAGLSRIKLRTFALAILTSRGPFTVLIVWAGNRVAGSLMWIALMMAVVMAIVIIGFGQREWIERWARTYIAQKSADNVKTPDTSKNFR